ncbi:hypothetical protein B9Z19DRAFT_1040272 [Tuber borchii]|uniref:Cysteine-rich protein n=4 Tax=Tuber TaxID=36048 RepID=A4UNV6_TUBBO|nr:hypothetical protein Tbz1 [Tuber borchii]ABO93225.1 hypothetical protein Tpz1 [Tuber puberulum]ABO93226.1 hypothetical protein Tbrz1 [Tuber brumale]ABO93227.1 hypothetical protein Taz1 [Tuber aestivum]PUU82833.1 hypothetical protein B9Z19DRAFT_1040272 [Tuber borchii]
MKLQTLLLPASFAAVALAGPISYGICQSGCAAVVVACYTGAGAVFGTVPAAAAAAMPAIAACNGAFGTCSATCATITLLAPIP